MKVNSVSHPMALMLIGALAIFLMSTSALADPASAGEGSGGGSPASGNAGGGYVGSGASGGDPSPSGNAGGGWAGSGGCRTRNGPVKFVPISEETETRQVEIGNGRDMYRVQERTATFGEYWMTVYTICVCDNTHQTETTSEDVMMGTDTRYSNWRTVDVIRG